MKTTLYIYLAIYTAILIFMSWYVSRKEDSEGFLMASRDRNWWQISISKFAGAIGVGYFVSYTGYAYEYGLSVYLIMLGIIIGYGFFGIWATPKLYLNSREKSFYTQGDFVTHSLDSKKSGYITNLFSNIISFGWLIIGMVGGAKIISHFGLMSYELALLATILVVLAYVLIAGFKAVLITDIFQSVIIIALMAVMTWIIVGGHGIGINDILSAQTGAIEISTAAGFFLFGVLSVFSASPFYQLIYAARDKRKAQTGLVSSIVPIVIVGTMLLMIGMYMFTQNPSLDSGLVFIEAMSANLMAGLLPLGIVLFFAGLMSSADTNLYAIASHHVFSHNQDKPVGKIKKIVVVVSVLSFIVSYIFRDIIDVTIVVGAISIILSTSMIYVIAGGKNIYRFNGSIFGGVVGLIIGLIVIGVNPALLILVLVGNLIGLVYNGWFIRGTI